MGFDPAVKSIDSGLIVLEPPRFPVSGATASMGYGDDLGRCCCDPINYGVGETPEEKFPCPVQVQRRAFRAFGNFTDSLIERREESICRGRIALCIPQISGSCLSYRVRMEFNAWASHGIGRGSDGARPTKEPSSPFPYPTRQYGARFLFPIPLPRPHPPSHPSFQSDDRQARPVLQQGDEELLRRPSCGSDSSKQFYISPSHQHKVRPRRQNG